MPDDAPQPVPNASRLPSHDGRSIVSFHCRCVACGYDLQGLYTDANCPECGQRVAKSLLGNLYRFAAPAFVRRVHLGSLIALIGWLSFVPGVLLAAVVERGLLSVGSASGSRVLAQIVGSVSYAALLYGWWLMSTPDPGVEREQDPRSRRVLRWTIILAASGLMIDPLWMLLRGTNPGLAGASGFQFAHTLISIALGLAAIAKLVNWFAAMVFARRMSVRLAEPRIDFWARFLLWTPLIAGGVFLGAAILGLAIAALSSAQGSSSDAGIMVAVGTGCTMVIGGLILMITVYILYAILLVMLRSKLHRACLQASGDPIPSQGINLV